MRWKDCINRDMMGLGVRGEEGHEGTWVLGTDVQEQHDNGLGQYGDHPHTNQMMNTRRTITLMT